MRDRDAHVSASWQARSYGIPNEQGDREGNSTRPMPAKTLALLEARLEPRCAHHRRGFGCGRHEQTVRRPHRLQGTIRSESATDGNAADRHLDGSDFQIGTWTRFGPPSTLALPHLEEDDD